MNPLLDIHANRPSLGDALGYIALMNATPSRILLFDTEVNRHLASLYYGLGPVLLTKESRDLNNEIRGTHVHFTRKLLAHYGLERYSCIPQIKLTPQEIECGRQLAAQYLMQAIVDANPGRTFVNFCTSPSHPLRTEQHSTLNNFVYVYDLHLRILASVYHAIGKYVGCDTGNYHLMLAVRGKCDVLIPDCGLNGYNYGMHLYPDDAFRGEEQRLEYIRMFSKFKRSLVGIKYPLI